MTVLDLIIELQALNPSLPVYLTNDDGDTCSDVSVVRSFWAAHKPRSHIMICFSEAEAIRDRWGHSPDPGPTRQGVLLGS